MILRYVMIVYIYFQYRKFFELAKFQMYDKANYVT